MICLSRVNFLINMTEEFLVRINVQELMFQQIHEKLGRNDVMNVVTVLKKKGGRKSKVLY